MPAALLEQAARRRSPTLDLYQGYGMTECVGGAHDARGRRPPRGRRCACARRAGRSSASSCRSRTTTATWCPTGETGEVCARAGNFMREYWNRPEETAEAFRGGWYHTGDAGYLDERGLPVPRRPREGHDRDRRRERVLDRGRERDRDAPGGRAGRGDRHPRTRCGARRARDRRAATGRRGDRAGDHRTTPDRRSPATRCRSRSSSAPSRCRCRAR